MLKLAVFALKYVDIVLNDQDNDFTFVAKVLQLVAKGKIP